jgi:hypothetical protein
MGLLATLTVLFIFLAILLIVVIAAAVPLFSMIAANFLKTSRHEWLTRYIITVPSFVASFTILYVPFSLYGLTHDWPFPDNLAQFFIALICWPVL